MASEYLIDANILIYAFDTDDIVKQQKAEAVVVALRTGTNAAISTQTLGEFYSVATKNIAVPLSHEEAYQQLEAFTFSFEVYGITPTTVLEAARAAHQYGMHYWDAQIWAVALLNQIPYILTEDVPGREIIEGVHFINPFTSEFDISSLV